ncbi:MAG: hypothetical protein LBD12_03975 [Clostridiales Family XIII bacterium]|jgi:pimeloyl-ACP methyl ester carboxylesterase|nr:hypothetical protein [Clostridiales Family XIII bacterium]
MLERDDAVACSSAARTGILSTPCLGSPFGERIALYARARAEGSWLSWVYGGEAKHFLRDFSLRDLTIPKGFPPVLLVHGTDDTDVPFAELRELAALLPGAQLSPFVSAGHGFDAEPDSPAAQRLASEMRRFVLAHL